MQEYYRGKTEERGKNVLEDEEKKSWAESFLEQLNDPLIFILFVAAAISLLLREYGDMAIILAAQERVSVSGPQHVPDRGRAV